MNIQKINTYNNICKYNRNNNTVKAANTLTNQEIQQTTSYNNKKAADAITNSKLSEINFTGHVENILMWKPANSNDTYNAKLEYSNSMSSGYSADSSAANAIKRSGQCDTDAKIIGHVENSDIDDYGPLTKTVYFSDPHERIYNGIKYSYDYVVYAPGAFDDGQEFNGDGEYDAVSDWESYGWIDSIGPSWL